jgi:Bacterial Ig-like domain (group 3)/FKBP-type peptidyl-prolyl cis-trans isomerase
MLKQNRSGWISRPPMFEPLEARELFAVATTTTITPSAKSLEFGKTLDILVNVKPVSGTVQPRGTVRLYLNKQAAVWTGTLNRKGVGHILVDPGLAMYPATYSLTVRYGGKGTFAASTSKKASFTVTQPKLIKFKRDHLGLETLTAGKGAAVVKGDSITVKESAYDSKGTLTGNTLTQKPPSYTFTVQANPEQVIKGFDEGVLGMKIGEVRIIEVPASLNTNNSEAELFVVELLSINA